MTEDERIGFNAGYRASSESWLGLPKIKAWVARCENGDLHCFISNDFRKPIRDEENPGDGYWRFDPPGIFTIQDLDPGLYSDLKWEDEPIEVELLIHRP